ncbi:MAG: urease accessory protein UreD [Myxococcaceae bacterium]|nr:urease accessory protein UreD [Myxococcaceae bacterium]
MPAARATLEVKAVAGRSVVTGLTSEQPLRLLAPSASDTAAWVYQSSLGGGFIGADALELDVRVDEGATLFLSSQASSKVYRAADARFTLRADVRGTLVYWPDPVVCFAGASLTQGLELSLAPGARLVCVDAYSAGRVARGEVWAFEKMDLGLRVDVAGKTVVREGVLLDPRHGPLHERMGAFEAFATAVLVGVEPPADVKALSRWPWGAVLRAGAASVEALSRELRAALGPSVVRLLGDDPFARKW